MGAPSRYNTVRTQRYSGLFPFTIHKLLNDLVGGQITASKNKKTKTSACRPPPDVTSHRTGHVTGNDVTEGTHPGPEVTSSRPEVTSSARDDVIVPEMTSLANYFRFQPAILENGRYRVSQRF